jgi:protein-ribulosamine 3-kinase
MSEGADFVKITDEAALPRLAAEADGLRALRDAGCVRVPTVRSCAITGGVAQLVVERFDLRALDRTSGATLGRALAQLHRTTGPRFGWPADNYIGTTAQLNAWHEVWPLFFRRQRLAPQFKLARARGLERSLATRGESLLDRLPALFIDYRPAPSLLHGDLWGGNAGALPDGTPVIFDPACYYGDRETDIAMTEIFGGFPDSFYAAYRADWPLDPGYETRKTMYNLYHILNHFNAFGASYLGQVQRMIDRLRAELG